MHTLTKYLGLSILVFLLACNAPETDVEFELDDQEFAVPLINSRLNINTVTDNTEGTRIEVDNNGKVTVLYKGDVVERAATDIFMPYDTNLTIPIIDLFPFPLPVAEEGDVVNRAIFSNTNIWFTYNNSTNEDLNITIDFLQFTQDGEIYSVNFEAPANTETVTDTFSVEGVEVITINNNIIFDVTAINTEGDTMPPGLPLMDFDVLDFNFVEGKFNERVFDIDGSFVVVGIFDNWISGNINFTDPKLTVDVDNGFGLPVESLFNDISILTTENQELQIESSLIEEGVTFAYPSLNEIGQTKRTQFAFDKDNSNIVELFGQRATRVSYDIDALVNPGSSDQVGFFDRSSFFKIDVSVEVPLEGTINEFEIEGDLELDASNFDDVKEASFKTIFENGFPIDMYSQAYFLDEEGNVLDSLFSQGQVLLEAAPVGADRVVSQDQVTTFEIPFSEARLDTIRTATTLRVNSVFDTPEEIVEPVILFDHYGLGVKMGALLTLK
jgi:hypothetical protein